MRLTDEWWHYPDNIKAVKVWVDDPPVIEVME